MPDVASVFLLVVLACGKGALVLFPTPIALEQT